MPKNHEIEGKEGWHFQLKMPGKKIYSACCENADRIIKTQARRDLAGTFEWRILPFVDDGEPAR